MGNHYEGDDDRRENRYSNIQHKIYEKPVFTLAGLFMLASGLIAVVLYVAEIEKGVATNASDIKHEREMREFQKETFDDSIEGVKGQLDKIDEKLDKLINRELDR